MAFDPDAFLEQDNRQVTYGDAPFDPDAFLQEEEGPGKVESFLRGAAQGATFGFADEIAAGLRSLGPGTYEEEIAKSRQRDLAAQEANPKTFLAGDLATLAIPGAGVLGAAGKGLRLAGKAKTAQKLAKLRGFKGGLATGALEGAAYGAGTAEEDRLAGALKGLLICGATGGALGGVASKLSPDALRKTSDIAAARSTGITKPQLNRLAKMQGAGNVEDAMRNIGQVAKEEGIVKIGRDVGDIGTMASEVKTRAGKEIGEIYQNVATEGIDVAALESQIMNNPQVIEAFRFHAGDTAARDKITGLLENIREVSSEGKISLQDLQSVKRNFLGYTPGEKATGGTLRKALDDAVLGAEGGAEIAEDLAQKNLVYGAAKEMELGADERVRRELANKRFGLTDWNVADEVVHGGRTGLGAAALLGAKKLGEKYGEPVLAGATEAMATGTEKVTGQIRNLLDKSPNTFGKWLPILNNAAQERGGVGLAATHYLLQKKDPEYKKKYEESVEQF